MVSPLSQQHTLTPSSSTSVITATNWPAVITGSADPMGNGLVPLQSALVISALVISHHFSCLPFFLSMLARGCQKLQNPENGNVQVTSTRIGAVAIYSCNDGFTLVGNKNRVCRPNGQWSGGAPSCQGEKT